MSAATGSAALGPRLASLTLGLGCMRLSQAEGPGEETALALLHRALDAGVRLFDTADVYAPDARSLGHNERLLARALATWRGDPEARRQVCLATKGGLRRSGKQWLPDGRAGQLVAACEASLRALGVERLDLYQLHAPDPRVDFTTSVRALAALREAGKVEHVGLCNVRLDELRSALDIVPVATVQVPLGAHDLLAVKGGVVAECSRRGIPVLAHSPLGGPKRKRRLESDPVLTRLASRHRASPQEIVLAWLRALGPAVVPLPGPSRMATLESCLRAREIELGPADLEELEHEQPAVRSLRRAGAAAHRTEPGPGEAEATGARTRAGDREVVLVMGMPAAGKSSLARELVARGYVRLNRDERGGSLAALSRELSRRLAAGERRLVLDNTYARRADRFDVIEAAREHGIPVRCNWLQTPLEEAQINAVSRLIERYDDLPGPDEIRRLCRRDPRVFGPQALFRYRRELEEPERDEGFATLERLPFVRRPEPDRHERALFLEVDGVLRRAASGRPYPLDRDDQELLPGRREALREWGAAGFRLLGIAYLPTVGQGELSHDEARAGFDRTRELLGVELEIAYCPHPPGPPVCWCRKPLPGLPLVWLARYPVDLRRSVLVGPSAADRTLAARLGCRHLAPEAWLETAPPERDPPDASSLLE